MKSKINYYSFSSLEIIISEVSLNINHKMKCIKNSLNHSGNTFLPSSSFTICPTAEYIANKPVRIPT